MKNVPEFGVGQGLAGVAPGGHGIGIAHGDALEVLEVGQISGLLAPGGHDEHQVVEREILARGRVHHLGGHGLVHGGLVGGGENVHGRAFLNLLQQRIGGGEVDVRGEAGMFFLKHALELSKGVGQAGRPGNGHFRGLGGQGQQADTGQGQKNAGKEGRLHVFCLLHE